jgi:hypothetical protein
LASFTDAISQFNPYVQQLPVEAMLKVGTYKQQKYEEGVQRIQGEIDKVAGLDVVRDVDKQYLQSKLNELGSKLKTVAAGDFSNFQLVNSVAGMANQIGKDGNVQNAVASTAWYRKQAAEMEKAISEGKSSQSNIWDFNQKADAWRNSTDIKQGFNGRYTQYTDVNKKFLDVLKSINPSATQEDIAYEIDPVTGKVDTKKIAAAMARKGYEGISSAKIENALNATLTPDEINQLSIDARYRFKDYGVPELQNYAKNKVANQTAAIDSRIESLEKFAKLKSSSPTDVTTALDSIKELQAKKAKIEGGLPSQLEDIARNPDGTKFNIYKEGYLDSFSDAFSWEKQKVELMTNPVLAADHWAKEYKLDQDKFNLDKQKFSWQQFTDTEGLKMRREEIDLNVAKTYGSASGFTTYAGESTNVKSPLIAMRQDAVAKDQMAIGGVKEIAIGLYGKATPENVGIIESAIRTYQNATTDAERNAIPVEYRGIANSVIENRIKANNINNAIAESERRAMANPALAGSAAAIDNALKSKKGFTLTIGGKPTYFSNKEILSYLSKEEPRGVAGGEIITGPNTYAQKVGIPIDPSTLTPKERLLYDVVKSNRYGAGGANATQSVVNSVFNQYADVLSQGRSFKNLMNSVVSQDMLERSGKYIPAISSIFVGSGKEDNLARARMESIVGTVLSRYRRDKGGAEGLDVSGAESFLTGDGKNDIQYQKVIQGDKIYVVMKKGGEEHMIPVTAIEASQLPKIKGEPSALETEITTTQAMNNGSTNLTGRAEDAIFQRFNFSNVKNFNVAADLKRDRSNSAIQYMTVQLKLPSGWKSLPLTDYPMDVSKAATMIGGFTDNEIAQLFLNSKNVPQSWKDEIKTIR